MFDDPPLKTKQSTQIAIQYHIYKIQKVYNFSHLRLLHLCLTHINHAASLPTHCGPSRGRPAARVEAGSAANQSSVFFESPCSSAASAEQQQRLCSRTAGVFCASAQSGGAAAQRRSACVRFCVCFRLCH
jgi:hypothetical protein